MAAISRPTDRGKTTTMRILVTGGTGFVGSWAASALADMGHEVFVCSRQDMKVAGCQAVKADLLSDGGADAVMDHVRPEIILHLAWYVEHGLFWAATENLDWVAATMRLAGAARKHGVRRFVGVGTCMEYDLAAAAPSISEHAKINPTSLYAVAKDASHRVLQNYLGANGIEHAWGRLFFLFGPNERIERLVPSVVSSLLAGRPALMSSGVQVRDFINVNDAGEALAALAVSRVSGAVNIGSGIGLSISQLAEDIRHAVGRPGELRFGALPDRPNDPPRIVADVSRLRDEVGYRPGRTMRERLFETVEWWQRRSLSRATAQA